MNQSRSLRATFGSVLLALAALCVTAAEAMPTSSSRQVVNVATVEGLIGGVLTSAPSNQVQASLQDPPGLLDYRDPSLAQVVQLTGAGTPLNLVADAIACNADPAVAESYPLTLQSVLSGDVEAGFVMTETGPDTGVFVLAQVPTARWPQAARADNDGVMQVAVNDQVMATLDCGGQLLRTLILIDPAGIVYDSVTDAPVAGATVTLIAIGPGGGEQPATVFELDGTPAPSTVVTGSDGFYRFPLVAAGDYRLYIEPPNGYRFPSQRTSAELPPARRTADGSWGAAFPVDASTGAVFLDVPLDPGTLSGFMLEKQAARGSVEIGETLRYTLRLRNDTGYDLNDVRIEDRLPVGFAYLSGSARTGGAALADPDGAPGRVLNFSIGSLAAGDTLNLQYVTRVGIGATAGDGVNRAQAYSGPAVSNLASHTVEVSRGVFSDEAMILGKVFVDCNRDDLQGPEELGIPGVRLYLDNGAFVVTDSEGKFSFYGLRPRTHTLKIDRSTLPPGAEMATLANRHAGDPHSRFVDLQRGELHRADFAEGSCTAEMLGEVKRRRDTGQVLAAMLDDDALVSHLRTEATPNFDPRTRPASGVIAADGRIVAEALPAPAPTAAPLRSASPSSPATPERGPVSPLGEAPLARVASVNLEVLLPELDGNRLVFMDLLDGDTLPGTDLSVRIAGRDGAVLRLYVNDELVPESRIGQRARMPSRDLQGREYIGVRLMPGANQLRAEALDGFGNLRETTEITLIAPGRPGRLSLLLPPDGAVADGQTPAPVIVRLLDADGVPVTARVPITLEATAGRWDVEDLDPAQPGVQTFIQGGEALYDLIPPAAPGGADLRISSGFLKAEGRLAFSAHLRPMIVAGVIEGAIGFNRLSADALAPVDPEDAFEDDIRSINAGGTAGMRGSMFLKGKVRGDYLLTLAYDSDRDTHDRLFRDIESEHFYPVYGDSSQKGFDAQSTSALYLRIDKGRSYLLYGDFNTSAGADPARRLSNYGRSLTGLHQHIETDRVTVNLFASHDRRRQQVSEFRAQGISGPYPLPASGYLRNSETIEVLTRDRNQPSVIVDTRTLTRFVDYSIDEINGAILFTRPVASVDAEFNPVYIRITWETESGGDSFWVYGADGRYRLTKWLEIGASAVRDDDPDAGYTLYGASATVHFSEENRLALEAARSEEELGDAGHAWRVEWTRGGGRLDTRIHAAESDAGFHNPNAALSSGRREAGVAASLRLSERLRFGVDGLHTEDRDTGGRRQGVLGSIDIALTQRLRLETGLRHTHDNDAPALPTALGAAGTVPREVTSARAQLSWNPERLPKANLHLEYEQEIGEADNHMLGIGGDWQISDRSRLYARHELMSSLTGPFGLSELSDNQNSTVFGIDWDYLDNANAFSEYRVRDSIDGAHAQAAMGLRNAWTLGEGLRLTTQFERVQPIEGLSQENTAVALGLHYAGNPLWRAGTRAEWRQSQSESSLLHTVAFARKLSLDWSFLGKNTLSLVERRGDGDRVIRDRLRIGLAWRQTDGNRWNWLGRYESRYDRYEAENERRHAHVLSSHVNWQPHRQWVLSGRYALKYVNEDNGGIDGGFIGHLVSARLMFDITERWDAGVHASTLFDRGSALYGFGGEVGYLITANLWLSAGYNVSGYSDRDFHDVDYTRHGPYLRLRFKFDEELFRWLE